MTRSHRSRTRTAPLVLMALFLGVVAPTSSAGTADTAWSFIAPMSGSRVSLAAASAPDGLYVLGGDPTQGCGGFCDLTDGVERYSAATDSWTTLAPMHMARAWHAATTGLDGQVYAIGGISPDCDCVTNSAEVYSPATDSWRFIAPLPVPRMMAAATTGTDGRIYLIGGGASVNEEGRRTFAYTPSTNTWAEVASMNHVRAIFGAATGRGGKIYAVGGSDTAEAYSPATDSWAYIAPPPLSHGYTVAASGHDGRIYLIAGCCTDSGDAFNEVDVYSPRTKTWSTAPSMLIGRSAPGAAVGGDGNLYVAGGNSGTSLHAFDSAEVLHLGQRFDLQLEVHKGREGARTLAYSNAGDLTSGGYTVDPSTGSPTSLEGTGTIPSTTSGDATVSFDVTFDDVTKRWTGTALIEDPGDGFSATIPVHSGPNSITRRDTGVRGRMWGIKAQSVPQKCFMIVFWIHLP